MDLEFDDNPLDSVDAANAQAEREEQDRDNESRLEDELPIDKKIVLPGDLADQWEETKKILIPQNPDESDQRGFED